MYDDYNADRFDPDEGDVGSTPETTTEARSYSDYLKDKASTQTGRDRQETLDKYNEELDRELDRASDQFDRLTEAYETTFGSVLGFGGKRATIAVDAMGNVNTYNPFGERVNAETAGDLARMQGDYELSREIYSNMDFGRDVPGIGDNLQRFGTAIANPVAERFGTSLTRDYVINAETGFIGEIQDDFAGMDAVGNVMGLVAPGGVRVDTALAVDARTGKEMMYQESSSVYGQHSSLKTPEEVAADRIRTRKQQEANRGQDKNPALNPTVPSNYAAPPQARSSILPYFLQATVPSIYPQVYQLFNEGGKVNNVEGEMSAVMANPQMENAQEIANNPDKFLKNPNLATTAEETQQIYAYNQQILDIAKTIPPQVKTAAIGGVQSDDDHLKQALSDAGPVGFIDKPPEMLDEATTVADDVPMEVPEGTFIINAAAVEFAGSEDIKAMLVAAMNEARKQGKVPQGDATDRDREDAVSLLVSRGEVVVPPMLAQIIGYDKLNKINNRGIKETERRVEENGQSPEAEAVAQGPENPAEGVAMNKGGTAEQEEFDIFDMYAKDVLGVVEGEKDDPHVPTPSSGVTIGRGVDLSRFLPEEFARMGVSDEIIQKTRPFQARGMGMYGPKGQKAEEVKSSLNLSFEEIQELNDKVYEYKKANFNKDFPEFKEAGPKDKAMAFSAYYVAGRKGMKERYVTFLDTYKDTGDIIKSMDKGFLKILKPGDTEYNRAFNAINWYLTADDGDLMRASAGEQAKYTKGMIEAFRRKEELQNAPAGSIPPPSRGKI